MQIQTEIKNMGLRMFFIFLVFQLNFLRAQAEDVTPDVNCQDILIDSNCQLNMTADGSQEINNALSNSNTRFVRLNPIVRPYYNNEFWRRKNRSDEIGKYFWVWTDGDIGRLFLSLEYSFVEMSLWTLSHGVRKFNVDLHEVQQGCWVNLNVTEQFCTLATLYLDTVREKARTQYHLQDSVICYNTIDLTNYMLSSYRCSSVSNVSTFHFSIEKANTLSVLVLSAAITFLPIYMYFAPIFYVSLSPKIFSVRYSRKFLANMKSFEINGPEAKSPLGKLFSLDPKNRMTTLSTTLCFSHPIAHLAIIFRICIEFVNYPDKTFLQTVDNITLIVLYAVFSFLSVILPIAAKSTTEFKKHKVLSVATTNIKYRLFRKFLLLPEINPNINCTVRSYLGDYISLEVSMKRDMVYILDLIKEIVSRVKSDNFLKSFYRLTIGLIFIVYCFSMLNGMFIITQQILQTVSIPKHKCILVVISAVAGFGFFYLFTLHLYSSMNIISVIIMALAGTIINYEIVIPYVILCLSLLYYVWNPFHDLLEKYRVLKAIVFKECSSSGPQRVELVRTNAPSDVSPLLTNDSRPSNYQHLEDSDEEETPTPGQGSEQSVLLYTSDDSGWERIPKDLWESIYKQLLPLDVALAKAFITSSVTLALGIFLMVLLIGFHKEAELPFIGLGIASFVTVSLPSLVLTFIYTDGSKMGLKRIWKVAVREKVKKYIQDNTISDQMSVN